MLIFLANLRSPAKSVSPEDRVWTSDIAGYFADRDTQGFFNHQHLLLILGVLMITIAIISLIQLHRQGRLIAPTGLVFRQVGHELGLKNSELRLLRQIAKIQGLSSPLSLLVCRATLIKHGTQAIDRLPKTYQAKTLKRCHDLADKLFTSDSASTAAANNNPTPNQPTHRAVITASLPNQASHAA